MNPQLFFQLYTMAAGGQWGAPLPLGPFSPEQGTAVMQALAAVAPTIASPVFLQGWQQMAGQAWQQLGGGLLNPNVKMTASGAADVVKTFTAEQKKAALARIMATPQGKKAVLAKLAQAPGGKKMLAVALLSSLVKRSLLPGETSAGGWPAALVALLVPGVPPF